MEDEGKRWSDMAAENAAVVAAVAVEVSSWKDLRKEKKRMGQPGVWRTGAGFVWAGLDRVLPGPEAMGTS